MTYWHELGEALWCANYGPSEGGVRMVASRDREGGLVVYSPGTRVPDEGYAQLDELGPVRWLLAPNHFHNLGLKGWRRRYPEARVVAHPRAHERLKKRCGLDELAPLDAIELAQGHRILSPPGAKQGETWLSVPLGTQGGEQRAWIVCDTFLNQSSPPPGFAGLVARCLGFGLRVNPLFWRLFLGDRAGFKRWFIDELERDQPSVLVPCHGDIVRGEDTSDRLRGLVERR